MTRRQDDRAQSMFDLYQQGHSLAQVGVAFGISRQSVFKMFAKRGYALRTIAPLPFIMWNGNKYTRRTHGYYGCTTEGRHYLHQAVWEFHNGEIPTGHHVHHKDEDKENNKIENLELITASDHGKLHSKTNINFQKTQFKPGNNGVYYPRKKQAASNSL